ncbi:helix-turn-helix domain-containing protein [Embleya sp. AB8]|uniref:ArsR/SmtB family transcription factor n=1 Tax=Embleya sp. AB8 TaxID=3156304 RepID=UPI003C736713
MTTPQPERQEITDLDALRLLAHPLRYRIARALRDGPATSTTLGRALGLSSGLASYHLRQLAQHGFIEEAPELAKGRERWWRAIKTDRRFPPRSAQTTEMRAVFDEMTRLDLAADLEQLARLRIEGTDLPGDWADAVPFSHSEINVTFDELLEFFEEYIALLYRYKRASEDTPPEARTVLTRFFAYPEPSEPAPERAPKAAPETPSAQDEPPTNT